LLGNGTGVTPRTPHGSADDAGAADSATAVLDAMMADAPVGEQLPFGEASHAQAEARTRREGRLRPAPGGLEASRTEVDARSQRAYRKANAERQAS